MWFFKIPYVFFWDYLKLTLFFSSWFISFSSWVTSKIIFTIFKFKFSFYDTLFSTFFHLYYCCLLNGYIFLLSRQQTLSLFWRPALNSILLTSSVNILCLLLTNLCCDISSNFLGFFKITYVFLQDYLN